MIFDAVQKHSSLGRWNRFALGNKSGQLYPFICGAALLSENNSRHEDHQGCSYGEAQKLNFSSGGYVYCFHSALSFLPIHSRVATVFDTILS